MSSTVSWSDSKVGYDPGQRQSLTVKYKKRDKGKLTFSFEFHAHSLGQDSYTSSQRHNVPRISIYHIDKDGSRGKKLGSYSWTYQCHGYKDSTSKSGSFTVSGAKNGETNFYVYYNNSRVGTNTPWYGPKSTGACGLRRVGKIKTDDNTKVEVKYYPGGLKRADVKNLPADTKIYKGSDYTLPNKIPTHKYYNFGNGYDVSDKWTKDHKVNTTAPDIAVDSKIKAIVADVDSTLKLWACWKPKEYTYHYYSSKEDASAKKNELKNLKQTRKYGKSGVNVPNLDDTNPIPGKTFKSWECYVDTNETKIYPVGSKCAYNKSLYFWPNYENDSTKIICHYGFDKVYGENDYIRTFDYTFYEPFDLMQACVSQDGKSFGQLNVRPGYKLMGWTLDVRGIIHIVTPKVFSPGQCTPNDYTFSFDYNGVIIGKEADKYSEGINLYAIWEYYSTLYVFTEGAWHLVLPMVYNDKKWTNSIAHAYINEDGVYSWKL